MEYATQIGGIAGLISLIIHTIQPTLALLNHKRVRSKCCGKDLGDTSIDVSSVTPPAEELESQEKPK
jgi:hypothetical protein